MADIFTMLARRGLIQLTGRDNYASFARSTGLDVLANPDQLLLPPGAARSAAWFWQSRGLNALADHDAGHQGEIAFERICKLVNGGEIGLAQRKALWGAPVRCWACRRRMRP